MPLMNTLKHIINSREKIMEIVLLDFLKENIIYFILGLFALIFFVTFCLKSSSVQMNEEEKAIYNIRMGDKDF
jgi:hypothetical protein